jgi:arylsulfatase A-like enzyme
VNFNNVTMTLACIAAATVIATTAQAPNSRPNIVFLIDESTDGRTYRPDFGAMHLTNIRKLTAEKETVQFDTHYVSAPVCCASRASIWSGRFVSLSHIRLPGSL